MGSFIPFRKSLLVGLAVALFLAFPSGAIEAEKPVYEVIRLSDTLSELRARDEGYIVKVLASVGGDGVLLVDTGEKRNVPALLESLDRLGGGPPRIVVNSHSHMEHWDGNRGLGKGPLYIGHDNLRKAMRSNYLLFLDVDESVLPQLTLSGEVSLHFNGEEIRVKSFAGAHDDSDLVVWFTRSRVAFVGALVTARELPTVDSLKGDIRKYPEITREVLDYLPRDVKLVPGHGEDADRAQGEAFLRMLEETRQRVRRAMDQGKSLETMTREDLLKDWASWETSYSSRNYWLKALYEGLSGAAAARAEKKTIFEPLYRVLKKDGPDEIPRAYAELKASSAGEYRLDEKSLLSIAMVLQEDGKDRESIPFFELCIREFPASPSAEFRHESLGRAYLAVGDKARAIPNLRKALELNPKSEEVLKLLKSLDAT